MKVGIALNMLSEPLRPDVAVVSDHLAMGDLAEPLGFDSLFALEHHFTGYAMSPAPLQLLAYFAGRTKRITFGTAVIVLPWHDPIRVAEEIALLDILSGGRCLFGFGRGAAGEISQQLQRRRRHRIAGEVMLEREQRVETERFGKVAHRQMVRHDRYVRPRRLGEHVERNADFHFGSPQ